MIEKLETERDYDAALMRIEEIFNAEMDTPEGKELDALVTLVEAYETQHHPIDPPDDTYEAQFKPSSSQLKAIAAACAEHLANAKEDELCEFVEFKNDTKE